MTWLLVMILIHADGSSTESAGPTFRSERECQRYGQAWEALANRRSDTDVAFFRCKARGSVVPP